MPSRLLAVAVAIEASSPASTRGRYTVKVVPRPGSLCTQTLPPLWRRMPNTVDSPRPVPSPRSFVVKKGSKIRDWVSLSIPTPVSVTVAMT